MMTCAALGNGAAKKTGGARHGKQCADAHAACRLAKNSDVGGITTKGSDILLYPLKGGNLIEQAEVGISIAHEEESIYPQAIIDGDTDDAIASKITAIILSNCARSVSKCAAMNPDHNRQLRPCQVRRPDIKVQAVFA